jgi:hypothetical protein
MQPLPFRMGRGEGGTRLPPAEAQWAEQALARAHAQLDPVLLLNPGAQRFPLPKVPAHSASRGALRST